MAKFAKERRGTKKKEYIRYKRYIVIFPHPELKVVPIFYLLRSKIFFRKKKIVLLYETK